MFYTNREKPERGHAAVLGETLLLGRTVVMVNGSGFSRMRDVHDLNKVSNIDEKVYR